MPLTEMIAEAGAESVHLAGDAATGLRAVVAVHSTVLGPSLGGVRFRPYPDERAAVLDALRLAQGMTYKHAVCGNDQGGGKAVIIGDPRVLRSDDLIRTYARFVDALGGRYRTAEDVGTTQADMDLARSVTPWVTGTSEHLGGSGDPSPATAWGVLHALGAVSERVWGDATLAGRHVAVVGVGKVGSGLARHLAAAGARLTLADVRVDVVAGLVDELRAGGAVVEAADSASVHRAECDILAPCALGGGLSAATIPRLRCAAVCVAANNQLATDADAARLAERGITYAPDYVVNAGGVINIAAESAPGGYDRAVALARVAGIGATLRRVFALADERSSTTAEAADALAEARLATALRTRTPDRER
jgi:valine dehydrogenase (NAD+)